MLENFKTKRAMRQIKKGIELDFSKMKPAEALAILNQVEKDCLKVVGQIVDPKQKKEFEADLALLREAKLQFSKEKP